MKKFLITILAFFIPVLFVLVGLEYIVRKAPNEYQYKAQWMEKNADRVETLILGTSHAFYGINPSYLGPNAFSLAASAQCLQYDEFLFFKYSGWKMIRLQEIENRYFANFLLYPIFR